MLALSLILLYLSVTQIQSPNGNSNPGQGQPVTGPNGSSDEENQSYHGYPWAQYFNIDSGTSSPGSTLSLSHEIHTNPLPPANDTPSSLDDETHISLSSSSSKPASNSRAEAVEEQEDEAQASNSNSLQDEDADPTTGGSIMWMTYGPNKKPELALTRPRGDTRRWIRVIQAVRPDGNYQLKIHPSEVERYKQEHPSSTFGQAINDPEASGSQTGSAGSKEKLMYYPSTTFDGNVFRFDAPRVFSDNRNTDHLPEQQSSATQRIPPSTDNIHIPSTSSFGLFQSPDGAALESSEKNEEGSIGAANDDALKLTYDAPGTSSQTDPNQAATAIQPQEADSAPQRGPMKKRLMKRYLEHSSDSDSSARNKRKKDKSE